MYTVSYLSPFIEGQLWFKIVKILFYYFKLWVGSIPVVITTYKYKSLLIISKVYDIRRLDGIHHFTHDNIINGVKFFSCRCITGNNCKCQYEILIHVKACYP